MSVRRGATRLATVGTLLGALVLLVAVPASADEDSVRVRVPSSFTAGGSAGSVTVSVSKRTSGCVNVRTALGVRLPGLTADRVEVQVAVDGGWRPVTVSDGGDGLVVAQRTAPDKPELCARKSVSARYRVTFLPGAPDGRATVVAEAYTAAGSVIARDSDTARVAGRKGASPSPTERVPELVVPTETPAATEEAETATAGQPGQAEAGTTTDSSLGVGAMVMVVGVVMVGIGTALLVLLLRRGRADRGGPDTGGYGGGHPGGGPTGPPPPFGGGGGGRAGGGDPTLILPGTGPTPPTPAADATLILPRTPPHLG